MVLGFEIVALFVLRGGTQHQPASWWVGATVVDRPERLAALAGTSSETTTKVLDEPAAQGLSEIAGPDEVGAQPVRRDASTLDLSGTGFAGDQWCVPGSTEGCEARQHRGSTP